MDGNNYNNNIDKKDLKNNNNGPEKSNIDDINVGDTTHLSLFKPIKRCGDKPWFVFMLVNIVSNSVKKTEIKIHSSPAVIEYIRNILYPSKKQIWKVVLCIGPFHEWYITLKFCHMWESGIRGCKSRLIRGLELFSKYKDDLNLVVMITPYNKKKAKQLYKRNKQNQRIFNVLSNYYEVSEEYNFNEYINIPGVYIESVERTQDDKNRITKIYNDTFIQQTTINNNIHIKTLAWIFKAKSIKI
jgi:hypothetical protein